MRKALNTPRPKKSTPAGGYPAPVWPVVVGDYRAEYLGTHHHPAGFGHTHVYRVIRPDGVQQDFAGYASEAAACAFARERVERMAARVERKAEPMPEPETTLF